MSLRLVLALSLLGAALLGCPAKKCDASSCPTGCCSGTQCVAPSNAQCGSLGSACVTCAPTQLCQVGVCSNATSGGGGGGGQGGGGGSGGGLGGGLGGGTGGGASFTQTYREVFTAYCDYLIRCGDITAAQRTDCIDFYSPYVGASLPSATQLEHIAFTPETAAILETCRTTLATASCGDRSSICNGLGSPDVVGTVPTGGACINNSLECASPADSCVGSTCPRQCRTVATGVLGAPCPRSDDCEAGLFCDSDDTCQALKAGGSTCRFSSECQSGRCDTGVCATPIPIGSACSFSTPCVSNAYCSGTCMARKALGAMCSGFTNECAEPNACINGVCAAPGGVGALCRSSFECRSDLSCDDVLRTCQNFRGVDAGQPCTDWAVYCNDSSCIGAVVNPDGGVGTFGMCGTRSIGSGCSSHYQCPRASFCDATRHCAAANAGTGCSSDSNCRATDYCAATQTCAARFSSGAECDSNVGSSCAEPTQRCFATPTDSIPKCRPPGAAGAPCVDSNGCGSFLLACINQVCTNVGHVGQPCFGGRCVNAACTSDGGCVAPQAVGSSCNGYGDCQSQTCFENVCATCP